MRYKLPPGYKRQAQPAGYKVFNNFNSGSKWYAPGAPTGFFSVTYNFVGTPANGSQLIVPDGPIGNPNAVLKTFTFTWAGSPGAGIIPLVAGGGTAAQAATAAATALNAQLTNWTATNGGSGVLTMDQEQQGISTPITRVGTTNMSPVTGTAVEAGAIVPGCFGKVKALLPVPASDEYSEGTGGGS